MKKAMIEVQFNWIFILIVGAIILLFFISLTTWIRESQEKQLAGQAMDNIKTTLTTTQMNPQTAQPVDVPDRDLLFTCDIECSNAGCPSDFQFDDAGIARTTQIDVIFAPQVLRGNVIHVWTQEWRMPYKVTNFQYISNNRMWFYLVYNKSLPGSYELAQSVAEKMEDNVHLNFELMDAEDTGNIKYTSQQLVKFVVFNRASFTIDESISDARVWDVLYVDEHTVAFYKIESGKVKRDPSTEIYYVGMPMLLGAMFSTDYNFFRCNMIKAFLKLRTVNEVYRLRSDTIYIDVDNRGDEVCPYYYGDNLDAPFNTIRDEATKVLIDKTIDDNQKLRLDTAKTAIEDMQSKATLKSCPKIY